MKIYEQKWWKDLFGKKEKVRKIDVIADLQVLMEFFQDLDAESKQMLPLLEKLLELEKEREVARSGIVHINLETQAELLDKILERYDFFQNDTDINGLRLRKITEQFLNNAQKEGLKDLVKEKKQDLKWKGGW